MNFQGNWIDIVIIFGTLIFLIDGIRAGLIYGILEFAGFVISLVAALLLFSKAAIIFTSFFSIPENFAAPAGFLLVWIAAETIYFFVAKRLFSKIPQNFLKNLINRFGGVFPAIVNSLAFWAFLLTLFVSLPLPSTIKSAIFNSEIGSTLVSKTAQLEKPLAAVFGPAVSDIQKSLTFITVVPQSSERINLNFVPKELRLDPASEERMLTLVNQERESRGLRTLVLDSAIREVGRAHSRDMFEKGYFSHYSPAGEDAADRLEKTGITYTIAGENLALAPDVVRSHQGLMDSPGHKRNILTAEFGKVGIGVVDGGIYGKMFTQVFID